MKFLSLLLGLVSGPHPIEVAVQPPVVAVELLLDGVPCARPAAPAWKGVCDLGAELAPHELVAVGRDAEGKEVARDRQWINLPRSTAEAQFLFETHDGKRVARLNWTSVVGSEPVVLVFLDDRPVKPDSKGWIALPEGDPEAVHVLEAELVFELGVSARAVATFGGRYGSSVNTELTAVPFELDGKPTVEELQGKFQVGGMALVVNAVDRVGADLIVVRQSGSDARLVGFSVERKIPTGLGKDGFVTFLAPYLHRVSSDANGPMAVFASSDWRPAWDAGVHWLRRRIGLSQQDRVSNLRLADAVAVAGKMAASRGRRRAVLLVLDQEATADESLYSPAQVRAFLDHLSVPLLVWNTTRGGSPIQAGWGHAEAMQAFPDFKRGIFQIETLLDRQTVVWFEGGHLPQRIVPAPGAKGIRRLTAGAAGE